MYDRNLVLRLSKLSHAHAVLHSLCLSRFPLALSVVSPLSRFLAVSLSDHTHPLTSTPNWHAQLHFCASPLHALSLTHKHNHAQIYTPITKKAAVPSRGIAICVCVRVWCSVCMRVCVGVRVHVWVCMCVYRRGVHVCVCIGAWVCVCVCVHRLQRRQ